MRQEPAIDYRQQIQHAFEYLRNVYPKPIQTGIILGTGLGDLINHIVIEVEIDYQDIPFFSLSTVESHNGKMIIGKLYDKTVIAMRGRFHYYEGYSMKEVTFPVRVMKLLGVENLLVSNAAGGLHPDYEIGQVMIINDHIDLFPENPLRGKNLDDMGVRFPDMSEPYDAGFIAKALKIAEKHNLKVNEGVYVGVQGPNLETRAEYIYLRKIGADAVGMSTIPEVIVARQMEMKVFALSAITDLCSPGKIQKISIAEVLAAAAIAEPAMSLLIKELVKEI